MDALRLFISVPLEPSLAKKISVDFKRLNLPWSKLKVVPAEQLHLTLKFLGDTPLDRLPTVISALETVKTGLGQIDLNINRGLLISPHRPQVISLSLDQSPELTKLFTAVDEAMFAAGLAHKEMRQFLPHITLARIKQSASAAEFSELADWQINRGFAVVTFDLQESVLGPRGPQYSILQSFTL